jgi:hypothetical protein
MPPSILSVCIHSSYPIVVCLDGLIVYGYKFAARDICLGNPRQDSPRCSDDTNQLPLEAVICFRDFESHKILTLGKAAILIYVERAGPFLFSD